MPKLAKFEDWTPPWGKDDSDFDAEKAKKRIYDLLHDKETLQDKVATVEAERDTAKSERDAAKAAAESKAREGETEVDRLKRENGELQQKVEKIEKAGQEPSIETLQLRVALRKGLDETQAKRLIGKTEAELEADADDLIKSFGFEGAGDDEDDGKGGDGVVRRPRRLHNPADPDPSGRDKDITVEQMLAAVPRSNGF